MGPCQDMGEDLEEATRFFWNLKGSVSSFSRSRAKKAAQLPRLYIDTASPSKSTTPYPSHSDEEWVRLWELDSW